VFFSPKELGQTGLRLDVDVVHVLQLEKRVNEVVLLYGGKKCVSQGRKTSGSSRYEINGARDSHCKGMPVVRQLGGIIRQVIIHS
jgi:hypothetical protein